MELQKFVMYCLRACAKAENNKEIWMHQAFGAVNIISIFFRKNMRQLLKCGMV